MTIFFTITCLFIAIFFLALLWLIDLKVRLLPNKYVAGFFLCGVVFHFLTSFYFCSPSQATLGMLGGGGLLFTIRAVSNHIYGFDTLGLGDVKLMAAAGFWLGAEHIFLSISVGAFAGLIHGFVYGYIANKKNADNVKFSTLSIPAGPGFIVGIIVIGIFKFYTLPLLLTGQL